MSRPTMITSAVLALGVASFAVPARADVDLSASLDKRMFVSGEEMSLTVTFVNRGALPVPLVRPESAWGEVLTVDIVDRATGDIVPAQVDGLRRGGVVDSLLLHPGDVLQRSFDLHRLFPRGMPPGRYELLVAYNCTVDQYLESTVHARDVEVTAKPVRFVVTAPDAAQQEQLRRYANVLAGASDERIIELARTALELEPAGLVSRRINIHLAAALWRLDRHAQAATEYERVLADPRATPATREMCRLYLGDVYAQMGNLQAALDVIEPLQIRRARLNRTIWRATLESVN